MEKKSGSQIFYLLCVPNGKEECLVDFIYNIRRFFIYFVPLMEKNSGSQIYIYCVSLMEMRSVSQIYIVEFYILCVPDGKEESIVCP